MTQEDIESVRFLCGTFWAEHALESTIHICGVYNAPGAHPCVRLSRCFDYQGQTGAPEWGGLPDHDVSAG